jgi:hypothetical protein
MIIYYHFYIHQKEIRDSIRKLAEENNDIIFNDEYQFNQALYEKYQLDLTHLWFDRSKSIGHFLHLKEQPPVLRNIDLSDTRSFLDICLDEANTLVSTGKKIKLLWSGGLDSTCILGALHNKIEDKSQLEIICTYASIYESGPIFDHIIKNNYNYQLTTEYTQPRPILSMCDDNTIVIGGAGGDQLWGTRFVGFDTDTHFGGQRDLMFHDSQNWRIKRKYPQSYLKEHIEKEGQIDYTKILSDEFIEFLSPAINSSPTKIETLGDLQWYWGWNFIWNTGLTRFLKNDTTQYHNRFKTFFMSPAFENWSARTKGGGYYHGHPQWRNELKSTINELIQEPLYVKYKGKSPSNLTRDYEGFVCCTENNRYQYNKDKNVITIESSS